MSHAAWLGRTLAIGAALLTLGIATPALGSDAEAEARVHFQKGMAAFELGKFQEALAEYERAYELAPLPGFLFNIGQCHRNLGNHAKAIFSFRLYLRKKPEARNREAVGTLISELEAKQRAEARRKKARVPVFVPESRPVVPPPPPPPPPTPVYKRWWLWTLVVAAAGGAAVGIYFAARPREASIPESDFPPIVVSRP
jgi:tetratricopeptide (TPR) repeat protein